MFKTNKFITLLLLLLLHFTNGLHNPHPHEHEHHHPPPHYEYGYSVHDEFTGDIKDHHEERHGDHVEGRYSLVEPTGERRVVKYHADDLHGFNAEVHCEGHHHHPPPAVHGPPPPPPPPAVVHPPHPHPEPHSHHEHHHEFHHEHHQEQHHEHHEHHPDHHPHPHPHPHPNPYPEPFKTKLLPVPIALGFHSPGLHPLFLMHHFH